MVVPVAVAALSYEFVEKPLLVKHSAYRARRSLTRNAARTPHTQAA